MPARPGEPQGGEGSRRVPEVEFRPYGVRVRVPRGSTVLEAARLASGDLQAWGLDAPCGGQGRCGGCTVVVESGSASGADEREVELLARRGLGQWGASGRRGLTASRLACRVRVTGDLAVRLPPPSAQARFQTSGAQWTVKPAPAVRLRGPGPHLGLAVDLGTTKIAAYLVDLEKGDILDTAACLNPQAAHGHDVIARLSHALTAPGGRESLRGLAAGAVNGLARELCGLTGHAPESICDAVVVGNTAMHHLFLGLEIKRLAAAPFRPEVAGPVEVRAGELGLEIPPAVRVHFLPCIAGYAGGDHVAVLLATELDLASRASMVLDIGTNTEISLARDGKITCCSCASGPAFEGAHISRGMRAETGAVDRVWLEDGEGAVPRYSVIGGAEPVGYCGSALVDLLAVLLEAGALDGSGRLRPEALNGLAVLGAGPQAAVSLGGVPFTQADVRQLQLAKGAIRSGVEALLAATGTGPGEVARVYLAGAFGVAVDPRKAVRIGMLPALPAAEFVTVGNAAGAGACLALLSAPERKRAEAVARSVTYLELAALPGYQELFLESLGFPDT
ncbi:MAG: DUF4445 domain-containing protein [Bacillota bacterium]|nr:MAG: DUF4445 domain-containing protein [Bacillota bacterium]